MILLQAPDQEEHAVWFQRVLNEYNSTYMLKSISVLFVFFFTKMAVLSNLTFGDFRFTIYYDRINALRTKKLNGSVNLFPWKYQFPGHYIPF